MLSVNSNPTDAMAFKGKQNIKSAYKNLKFSKQRLDDVLKQPDKKIIFPNGTTFNRKDVAGANFCITLADFFKALIGIK